jgi:hypothetical protein
MTDDGCPELLYEWIQTKLPWLQNPEQMDGHSVNSIQCENGKHLRNK